MTVPALVASGVEVTIGGRRIVGGVDLELHHGEIVALVGPNGCGKSTLLSGLTGLRPLSGGTVSLDGTDLTKIGALDLARRRALVTQSGRTDIPFVVHEVVEMGRFPWSRTPQAAESAAIIAESMTECDLTEIRDQPFSQLSGGQQARVSLARALAQHATILMLDEPTAALDIHHQERVLALLARRRSAGAAILIIVHDLSLAAAYADRVILMKAGQIVAAGPTASVMKAELLSQIYDHPVVTWTHPDTGQLVVLPDRSPALTDKSLGSAGHSPLVPRRPEP